MTNFSADWSRRKFLRGALATGALVLPGTGLLAGCATSGGGQEQSEGEKSDKNPLGVPEDQPLEIYIFNGGFGDKYATDIHEPMYKKAYPKATIDHKAEVDIAGALQSRFVGGNPPDFVNDSGDGQIPLGQLVSDKQLYDLSDLYDAPELGRPEQEGQATRSCPAPSSRAASAARPFVMQMALTVYGIWYNKALFDKNGWKPPEHVGRDARPVRGHQGRRHRAVDLPGHPRPLHVLAADHHGREARRRRDPRRRSTTSRKAPGTTRRSRSPPTRCRA